MPSRLLLTLLSCALLLGGCGLLHNYDQELQATNEQLISGNVDGALQLLERHNPWDDKDLLYYLEKGELLRAKGDLSRSQDAWRIADQRVSQYEEGTQVVATLKNLGLDQILGIGLIGDKFHRYEGYDYEKVMLTTQMALNQLARNDFDDARVDIKKSHEREALIATARDKQYLAVEDQAKAKGIKLRYKDLQGYPVTTLDSPQVIALKNGYQSAFSHYLAGFVYEALGERDLAAPGYRQAIELRPNTPLLEKALSNLGKPADASPDSDVLIIVQTGLAPALVSLRVPIQVQTEDGQVITVNQPFPVLVADKSTAPLKQIGVDGKSQSLTLLNSTTHMSLRTLHDDMPAIINFALASVRFNAELQAKENKRTPAKASSVYQGFTGDSDTRTWRTLPDNTLVVRLRLKPGAHKLLLSGVQGAVPVSVNIEHPFQVISLRVIGHQVFLLPGGV
ncbi:COG3014 family protein [Pseudomonas sp.]|uniref:COG3014 family protein n=1 Tax=Pseudomonas sp. TaxID=306 RepID=UPI003F94EC8F